MKAKHPAGWKAIRIFLLLATIFLVITVGFSGVFYTFASDAREAKETAVLRAKAAALLAETYYSIHLDANGEEVSEDSEAFNRLRTGLERYRQMNREILSCFMLIRDTGDSYRVLRASSGADVPAEGNSYSIGSSDLQTLGAGQTVLSDPDPSDDFFTVLVPIPDPEGASLKLVFGISYSVRIVMSDTWQRALSGTMIVMIFLLLLLGIYYALQKNESLRTASELLLESELRFREIYEQAPVGIAIVSDYTEMISVNAALKRILGYPDDYDGQMRWTDITYPDDLDRDLEMFEKFKTGEIPGYAMDKRYLRKDGSPVWVHIVVTGLHLTQTDAAGVKRPQHICIVLDIHEKKLAEEALGESERSKAVLLANIPGMAYRCLYDEHWTMMFMSEGCLDLTGYPPEAFIYNRDLCFSDIILPEHREMLWKEWGRILPTREPFRFEYEIITRMGEHKWVLEIGRGVYIDEPGEARVAAIEGIIIDITESKHNVDRIRYMNDHDFMTGLYNRKFFEEEKTRLIRDRIRPVSVLTADINGVRLINDAFGQEQGDFLIRKTAELIGGCVRKEDILARVGGDEFSILMPYTNAKKADATADKIRSACERFNRITQNPEQKINLTIASGTCADESESIDTAVKDADEAVRKRKLFERKSTHSSLLASILATLYARSQETEEHAMRIARLCRRIGKVIHLPQRSLDNLQIFSMLHDIGKIGIEDRILNKPGQLNDEEWTIMQRHPEIGFRIVMSAPELEEIAQLILSHHERWDGKGYPRGLAGEDIPLVSRILSVVDAYDAMTEDRVYRKAMAKEDAIEEIRKNSGTQFDPTIVAVFLKVISETEDENETFSNQGNL